MTEKDFDSRTSVGLRKGEKFAAVVSRLKAYRLSTTTTNLVALRKALTVWQTTHNILGGAQDSWKLDRRNNVRGKGNPVEELSNWVDRKLIEGPLTALFGAATAVMTGYGDWLDAKYRSCLIQTFLGTPADSVAPLACFFYWDNAGHWTQRLNGIGAPPKTDAFCISGLTTTDKNGAFGKIIRISSDDEPMNRQMEWGPNPDHHSLVHELLHWCTHKKFEDFTHGMADATLGKFIREGLTEYMTRSTLNEWNKGGYTDFFPVWKEIFQSNTITIKDVAIPYFHGVGLQAFCDKVTPLIQANSDYQTGKKMEAFVAALNKIGKS